MFRNENGIKYSRLSKFVHRSSIRTVNRMKVYFCCTTVLVAQDALNSAHGNSKIIQY